MSSPATPSSRHTGALHCLAVCDALGAPLEFGPRRHPPNLVTTMLPNKNFDLPSGHFTDDTSMALCLAHSLLDNKGKHVPADQARRYVRWSREGYMSSVGRCFDIGITTRRALDIWAVKLAGKPPGGSAEAEATEAVLKRIQKELGAENCCGNGSLMRCLPCVLVAKDEEQAVELARGSSEVTHPHERCKAACEVYVRAVWKSLQGESKEAVARSVAESVQQLRSSMDANDALLVTFDEYKTIEDWQKKKITDIKSTGYVVSSLEAALWAFFTTDTLKEGAIKVVNLGDDADTVGAIHGGLAGAFYGMDEIPKEWLNKMKSLHMVEDVANKVLEFKGLG